MKDFIGSNNKAVLLKSQCDAGKSFSFDTLQSTNTHDAPEASGDSVFDFNFNNTVSSTEQTAGQMSAFQFNAPEDGDNSAFTMDSKGFDFSMDNHGGDSSMFDFTIRNKENSSMAAASMGGGQMFNFGGTSVTSPTSDQSTSGFLFDLNKTDISPVASNNQFSFTF